MSYALMRSRYPNTMTDTLTGESNCPDQSSGRVNRVSLLYHHAIAHDTFYVS